MNPISLTQVTLRVPQFWAAFVLIGVFTLGAMSANAQLAALDTIKTRADLDAMIAVLTDASAKGVLKAHAAAILSAAARKPHVDAVIALLDSSPGKYAKINVTPDELKNVIVGEPAIFNTLTMVDLGSVGLGVKAKREIDPFDATFYEHLGQIEDLESITILNTVAQDAWLAPMANLTRLKSLRIVNQSLSEKA